MKDDEERVERNHQTTQLRVVRRIILSTKRKRQIRNVGRRRCSGCAWQFSDRRTSRRDERQVDLGCLLGAAILPASSEVFRDSEYEEEGTDDESNEKMRVAKHG